MIIYDVCNGNNIGEKGKKALREVKNSNLKIIIAWDYNFGKPVYLWMNKKLEILARKVVLKVMEIFLFGKCFWQKVMGNWGIKQMWVETIERGMKSYGDKVIERQW